MQDTNLAAINEIFENSTRMISLPYECLKLGLLITLVLCATAGQSNADSLVGVSNVIQDRATTYDGEQPVDTSVTVYKEPSGLLLSILKELFTDIDWQTIEEARVQIEKFIRKVKRIVGSLRSVLKKAPAGGAEASSREGQTVDGRFWWDYGKKSDPASLAADSTSVKEMLQRVACFVGHLRLMNLSNESLAELDASKAVTNLFGSIKRNSSSPWSWFG